MSDLPVSVLFILIVTVVPVGVLAAKAYGDNPPADIGTTLRRVGFMIPFQLSLIGLLNIYRHGFVVREWDFTLVIALAICAVLVVTFEVWLIHRSRTREDA